MKEKRTDFPFNFYIVTFGDSVWREKNRPLKTRYQLHFDFTKLLGPFQGMETGKK